MNAEISELYKREGVNPAGGCLPLLIQLPFLWAFYSMLGNAIELRHAQFLWIHDLSSPDKLYILPVLIVASTFYMQKLTPSAGMDPAQQTHDDLHDAGHAGLLQLVAAVGLEPLLDDGQRDRHHSAIGHEPHRPGQRDARRDGEARS